MISAASAPRTLLPILAIVAGVACVQGACSLRSLDHLGNGHGQGTSPLPVDGHDDVAISGAGGAGGDGEVGLGAGGSGAGGTRTGTGGGGAMGGADGGQNQGGSGMVQDGSAAGAAGSPSSGGGGSPSSGGGGSPSSGGGGSTSSGVGGSSSSDARVDPDTGRATLIHLYKLDGTGTVLTDSVGHADGKASKSNMLSGNGDLVLLGTGDYASVPSGILSTLTDVTFDFWVTWGGGTDYHIMDFGNNVGSDQSCVVGTYIYIAPASNTGHLHAEFNNTAATVSLDGSAALPSGIKSQIILTLSQADQTMRLYLNGGLVGQSGGLKPLSTINDATNWLGTSQSWCDTNSLKITYHTFRIYSAALSAAQIKASYAAGPE